MPVGVGLTIAGGASAYASRKNAKDATKAAGEAAGVQADSQQEALDYLKQINALPQELREQALRKLGDYFQTPGAPKDQQTLIGEAMNSPLYASIMGTQDDALEGVARYASASVQGDDRYERALQLSGLSGLAGLDTGAAEIANLTTGIGETNAAGILGGAQAKQQGNQNMINNLLGIAGLGINAYGNGMIKV